MNIPDNAKMFKMNLLRITVIFMKQMYVFHNIVVDR